jgi:hypothetical protein
MGIFVSVACWDVLCESESHIVGMMGEEVCEERMREGALGEVARRLTEGFGVVQGVSGMSCRIRWAVVLATLLCGAALNP